MGAPLRRDLQRVLVVCPSWVGDLVMCTPVLRAVRQALPAAHLVGLLRPGLEGVLLGSDFLDELLPGAPGVGGTLRSAARLRHLRLQAALLLPNSFRSAVLVALAGIPIRIGYARDRRRFLLSDALSAPRSTTPLSTVEDYLRLARWALGEPSPSPRLELVVTDEEAAEANRLLGDCPRPFVLLNPGAVRSEKRWPTVRFAQVAVALAAERGLAIAVSGSPAERSVVADVVSRIGPRTPAVDLVARGLTLSSLKAVIAQARLLITNDTGPRHIAAALGTPVVSLFGPTDWRWTVLPEARERIVLADPFLPEEQIADRCPRRCHIEKITAPDVLAAAAALLDGAGAATAPAPNAQPRR